MIKQWKTKHTGTTFIAAGCRRYVDRHLYDPCSIYCSIVSVLLVTSYIDLVGFHGFNDGRIQDMYIKFPEHSTHICIYNNISCLYSFSQNTSHRKISNNVSSVDSFISVLCLLCTCYFGTDHLILGWVYPFVAPIRIYFC